jgi:hypothetical protein
VKLSFGWLAPVTFTPASRASPDRLDAMVMALTDLMLGNTMGGDITDLIEVNDRLRGSAVWTPDAVPSGLTQW